MKAPHWTERRRDYLAGKDARQAPVINIAEGYLRRTARVTADDSLAGFRCTTEFLADRLEPETRGKKGAKQGKSEGMGAALGTAPQQLEFPAGGDAA